MGGTIDEPSGPRSPTNRMCFSQLELSDDSVAERTRCTIQNGNLVLSGRRLVSLDALSRFLIH
jgi:hypothetical protein